MQSQVIATPFEIGYEAGRAGREFRNPYREGSFSHTDFESGYWRGREKRDSRADAARPYYETH
jgi:hypothetical protein